MNKKAQLQLLGLLANPWVLLGVGIFILLLLAGVIVFSKTVIGVVLVVAGIVLFTRIGDWRVPLILVLLGALFVWNPAFLRGFAINVMPGYYDGWDTNFHDDIYTCLSSGDYICQYEERIDPASVLCWSPLTNADGDWGSCYMEATAYDQHYVQDSSPYQFTYDNPHKVSGGAVYNGDWCAMEMRKTKLTDIRVCFSEGDDAKEKFSDVFSPVLGFDMPDVDDGFVKVETGLKSFFSGIWAWLTSLFT